MAKYVWCEDSGSGFLFWTIFFHAINPEIIVESKNCNSGLVRAVAGIKDSDENQYYILLDNAVDNPAVLTEVRKLADLSRINKKCISVRA